MSVRLDDRGRAAGNREVSRSAGRVFGAAGEKGARGGMNDCHGDRLKSVPMTIFGPTIARHFRAMGVEVDG
jgi:hypothetical protein